MESWNVTNFAIHALVNGRWISVIEGYGSYGNEADRLEIMGGFTPLERFEGYENGSVKGWLTAHNVYKRIKNHYEGRL